MKTIKFIDKQLIENSVLKDLTYNSIKIKNHPVISKSVQYGQDLSIGRFPSNIKPFVFVMDFHIFHFTFTNSIMKKGFVYNSFIYRCQHQPFGIIHYTTKEAFFHKVKFLLF